MNRTKLLIATAALAAALLGAERAAAQVEKQVEVTKAYVPQVQPAAKLPVAPDLTDTARMRPEITYTITPLALNTPLEVQPLRPATVTYWTFNRPLPCYLKLGAGYPLRSVADFYVATQHPDTGYALGYLNHEGYYAKIRNDFDIRNRSTQLLNKAGAAAGKYFGSRTLEGALSFENRLYHRYGAFTAAGREEYYPIVPGARINDNDAALALRFGDDFHDLSRLNFEVSAGGDYFFDRPEGNLAGAASHQFSLQAGGRLARAFGRHRLALEAGYERLAGSKAIAAYGEQLIRAGLRYGVEGGRAALEAGLDYVHDRMNGSEAQNYLLPVVRLQLNFGTPAIRPFLEVDGSLHDNSYRTLTREMPYVAPALLLAKRSADYTGRLGIRGDLWRERFTYRLYAACAIRTNHNYWYTTGFADTDGNVLTSVTGTMFARQAEQTVVSFHGEAEFRPMSELLLELGLHGYLYHDEIDFGHGEPGFRGRFGVHYTIKRVTLGLTLDGQTRRNWTLLYTDDTGRIGQGTFRASAAMNLRFLFDWRISGRFGLFAEGDNLLNQRLYRFAGYPEYGAGFTAGIKWSF